MHQVNIHSLEGVRRACLREITGQEEQGAGDAGTAAAIRLIDQLLCKQGEYDLAPGMTAELTSSNRDALLGSVYKQTYGSKIESILTCLNCETPFELSFQLAELLHRAPEDILEDMPRKDSDGWFSLNDHCRFRLPTGHDELAIIGVPREEAEHMLISRCIIEGDPVKCADAVQEAMQKLAPVCDVDLSAECPECRQMQPVHFNLQSYLLTALALDRPRLAREVHRLASAYGWSLQEIMGLPRSQRRTFVELVESEFATQGEGAL